MAKPRIFVSSTYYDLKHIRYSLDIFISQLGFESILSEKGDIAYSYDTPLDESCYREVNNVDIFVLIIGGRYGSEVSTEEKKPEKKFYDRYESITKREFDTAITKDIPTYILIESNVYSEFRTFQKNKENIKVNYAHVDSVNIFHFIEDVLSKPRNNPIKSFEKFDEIEGWLKDQWSGLFKDLLGKRTNQNQIRNLASEINQLQEVNKTLKKYLEEILKATSNSSSDQVIKEEDQRLSEQFIKLNIKLNNWFLQCSNLYDLPYEEIVKDIREAKSLNDYISKFPPPHRENAESILMTTPEAVEDLNNIRSILGLKKLR